MLLRIFTRRDAREVDPGDVIEKPKELKVEEVRKTIDGLELWGRRTPDTRRLSIKLDGKDPVESPVSDQDTIVDTLRSAFEALQRQHQEDGEGENRELQFEWHADERAFYVRTATGWVWIAVLPDKAPEPVTEPAPAPRPAKAAAKRAPKNVPATPPADAEPDIST